MVGFGFRQPQFSEDVDWLPAWLQPHQGLVSDEQVKDSPYKDAEFLQKTLCSGRNEDYISKTDAGCGSFHLFLSGDSHSQVGNTPSSLNVLHFDLHLSSDDISQYTLRQFGVSFQKEKEKLDDVQPMQSPHKTFTVTHDCGQAFAEFPPSCIPKLSPTSQLQPLCMRNKKRRKKLHKKNSADINNAVELSIAASEALVISETMKSGLPSIILPAKTILEIALQVKQARKECCESDYDDGPVLQDDYFNVKDELSDLDETSMADAFEDVGLSGLQDIATPKNSYDENQRTPHLDRYISSNTDMHFSDSHSRLLDAEDLDIDCTGVYPLNCSGGVSFMRLRINDSPSKFSKAQKGILFDAEGDLSINQSNTSSRQPKYSRNNEENVINNGLEHFRSRWFGGWTATAMNVSVHCSGKTRKCIPKLFVNETSLLSESVDTVMDESCVNKPEINSKELVPSGKTIEVIHQMSFSQQVVGSCNFSSLDPFCSVVPCSISLDNTDVSQSFVPDNSLEENVECFYPTMVPNTDPVIPLASLSRGEEDHSTITKKTEKSLEVTRKQSSSLKMYSMGRHTSNGEPCNPEALDLLKNERTKIISAAQDTDSSNMVESKVARSSKSKTNNQDFDSQGCHCKERSSPIILNHGKRHRICACDTYFNNSEKSLRHDSASYARKIQSDELKHQVTFREQSNMLASAPFVSSLHLFKKVHAQKSGTNKRVRFLETEILSHMHDADEKRHGHPTCSPIMAGKKKKNALLEMKIGKTKASHKKGRLLFQGLEFLLTGFSNRKRNELEMLIRKHGGVVLFDVPLPSRNTRIKRSSGSWNQQLPVVVSRNKLQTTKFLYGCAVKALLVKSSWLVDSIAARHLLPPKKYLVLSNQATDSERTQIGLAVPCCSYIFDKVGIMLCGKSRFCSKLGKIVRYGGGQVFKTLRVLVQSLKSGKNSVGVVIKGEGQVSRHLRHCVSEQGLTLMPASWIIDSLYSGKLLPIKNSPTAPSLRNNMAILPAFAEGSEEV